MTVTPEELVAQIRAENHAALKAMGADGDEPVLVLALLDQGVHARL